MNNSTERKRFFDMTSWRIENIARHISTDVLQRHLQPSAKELVEELDRKCGVDSRWYLEEALESLLSKDSRIKLKQAERDYVVSLLKDKDSLAQALREERPDHDHDEKKFYIDELLKSSRRYRNSGNFRELMSFVARFPKYSPYNNMLVHTQDPSCGYFATENVWFKKFKRWPREDARPLLILAPYGPVKLVYSLDQTDGKDPLPKHLERFAKFEIKTHWEQKWWDNLSKNAVQHGIRVNLKPLSKTHGGFCTRPHISSNPNCRIVVHDGLDPPSGFGVLCHEVAHILLGHLGADKNGWWPSRCHLGHNAVEVEAEAVAYVATRRLGLIGTSHEYVSRHLKDGTEVPEGVSLDMITRIAGRIEKMSKSILPEPKPRSES